MCVYGWIFINKFFFPFYKSWFRGQGRSPVLCLPWGLAPRLRRGRVAWSRLTELDVIYHQHNVDIYTQSLVQSTSRRQRRPRSRADHWDASGTPVRWRRDQCFIRLWNTSSPPEQKHSPAQSHCTVLTPPFPSRLIRLGQVQTSGHAAWKQV